MSYPALSIRPCSKSFVRTVRSQWLQTAHPDVRSSTAFRGKMPRCHNPLFALPPMMAPPMSCRIGNVLLSAAQPTGWRGQGRRKPGLQAGRCAHRCVGGLQRPYKAPAPWSCRRSNLRLRGRVWGNMMSRSLRRRFLWKKLAAAFGFGLLEALQ
jgi:hypothetical protein